jgi:hypothetical protein
MRAYVRLIAGKVRIDTASLILTVLSTHAPHTPFLGEVGMSARVGGRFVSDV